MGSTITEYSSGQSLLYNRDAFYTQYVSDIETDRGLTFKKTRNILNRIGYANATVDDCAIVHYVCRLVTQRAAKLLAGALSAVLFKMARRSPTIGIDGSLYRYHPKFKHHVEYYCNLLLEKNIQYRISLATDGSGIGAALAAAAATTGTPA
ncbi:hypothetical protein ACOME3_001646 [Neoechinorhynchus agilis]